MAPWRSHAVLVVPGLVLLAVFFVVPTAAIFQVGLFEDGFTTAHVNRFLSRGAYLDVFLRTVCVSLLVAFICTLVGYPAAYFIARQPPRRRAMLVFLVLVPMWMSVLVRAYAWMVVLGREGVINSSLMQLGLITAPYKLMYTTGAVYVTMVQILAPFVIMPSLAAMIEIDQGLVRAARILGATGTRAFVAVFLPLSLEGVVTGFVIAFMLGMGFFITPALVGGPQDTMMANLIATQVEHTNWGFAAVLAIILLLATLAVMVLVRGVARRFLYVPGREAAR